ncbi:3'(2'),5'-bisphosphate nucleotidase CysQ [Sphingomonas sp. Leaf407]|uniref:3'(2'),5'-bisphosphate nucleotidase CysQ n=1 Tax=unclassified Sphingomonas TaxID=196159 RepID=UPI0006F9F9C7|nr:MULTISPECIES: 3'(2'),5'-bisphosphate nucleotidase CysQ [unclassified Sphingomonas]KQN40602.1 3'(2'),5'-bisphosphate nucleotidase CysQ [Sphingomonas sp. Leaf42]KQT29958.1 3'(2'),5'-bisphosphate nucleotidase CysQ [Sphingomonas sp. Leaf407]
MADAALLGRVVAIAGEAAALAHARFRGDFATWEKAPGNPVCEVDLAVDRLLRERLSALLPDAGWLSEETADDADRLMRRRVWIVDPIDGTRDYIRGRDGWAVSIALVEDGQPVLGVLHAPARGQVWTTLAGAGAHANGSRIHASTRTDFAGSRTPVDALAKADRDLAVVAKPNSIALRMAMVASGDADFLATLRWGNEWDVAASILLAREAGATVTDAIGRKLRFNQPRPQFFGVMAAAPGIHAAAVERLRDRAIVALGKR